MGAEDQGMECDRLRVADSRFVYFAAEKDPRERSRNRKGGGLGCCIMVGQRRSRRLATAGRELAGKSAIQFTGSPGIADIPDLPVDEG